MADEPERIAEAVGDAAEVIAEAAAEIVAGETAEQARGMEINRGLLEAMMADYRVKHAEEIRVELHAARDEFHTVHAELNARIETCEAMLKSLSEQMTGLLALSAIQAMLSTPEPSRPRNEGEEGPPNPPAEPDRSPESHRENPEPEGPSERKIRRRLV